MRIGLRPPRVGGVQGGPHHPRGGGAAPHLTAQCANPATSPTMLTPPSPSPLSGSGLIGALGVSVLNSFLKVYFFVACVK